MDRRWPVLLAATAAVAALAGCADPPHWTPSVDPAAPSEGGLGPREVQVDVVADGPSPATVILAWLDPAAPGNGTVHVQRLGLRSANGTVVGHVPDDRTIHVIASAPATTEEWVADAFQPGSPDRVRVRVHPLQASMTFNDTWSGVEVGAYVPIYFDRTVWKPTPLRLAPDDADDAAMQERIIALAGSLRWTNTATAFGDLGILAATRDEGDGCEQHDSARDLGPGQFVQEFSMPYTSRCNFLLPFIQDVTSIAPPIDVGPATSDHLVAPLEGVPYTIEVDATLAASWGWQPLEEEWGDRDVKLHWAPVSPEQAGAGDAAPGDAEVPVVGPFASAVALLLLAFVMRRRASAPAVADATPAGADDCAAPAPAN